jgi:hypothetical protein
MEPGGCDRIATLAVAGNATRRKRPICDRNTTSVRLTRVSVAFRSIRESVVTRSSMSRATSASCPEDRGGDVSGGNRRLKHGDAGVVV